MLYGLFLLAFSYIGFKFPFVTIIIHQEYLGIKEQVIGAMTDSAFKTMGGCLNCSLKPLSRVEVTQMDKDSL